MRLGLIFLNVTICSLTNTDRILNRINERQDIDCLTAFVKKFFRTPSCLANIFIDIDFQHFTSQELLVRSFYSSSELVEATPFSKPTLRRINKNMKINGEPINVLLVLREPYELQEAILKLKRHSFLRSSTRILIVFDRFITGDKLKFSIGKIGGLSGHIALLMYSESKRSGLLYAYEKHCFTKLTRIKQIGRCESEKLLSGYLMQEFLTKMRGNKCELRVGARVYSPYIYEGGLSQRGMERELIETILRRFDLKAKMIYFKNTRNNVLYEKLING